MSRDLPAPHGKAGRRAAGRWRLRSPPPVSPARPRRDDRLRSYHDAIDFLRSLVRVPPRTRRERERLGLSPVESLLERIGNPHRALAAVHVTGSHGKGSTALYTEALLTAAGLRTGAFTSPHLETWNERIRLGGAPIDAGAFVEALERVRPAVAALYRADADAAPAFFDALAAAAFRVFADAPVDIAVIEAGIGARLDPTRVCRAVATCVTGVDLEHTDRLGPTIRDIAREKAAIARRGVPLVTGSVPEAAREVLEHEAARAGAPLLRLGRDFTVRRAAESPSPLCRPVETRQGRDGSGGREGADRTEAGRSWGDAAGNPLTGAARAEVVLAGRAIPITLRQPGRHMIENAALALALANEAGALDRLDDAAAAAALESAVLPGRAEVLRARPLVIADGAHTPAAIGALLPVLGALDTTTLVAVVSVTRDKDAVRMLSPLVRRADAVIATTAEPSRSLPAAELAGLFETAGSRASIVDVDPPADAIRAAMRVAGNEGAVCVTGSMYLAGAARRMFLNG